MAVYQNHLGNFLKIQLPGPHPRPVESEFLDLSPVFESVIQILKGDFDRSGGHREKKARVCFPTSQRMKCCLAEHSIATGKSLHLSEHWLPCLQVG